MSAVTILDDLRNHGATVILDAGTVRIKAPTGTIPAVLIEMAREAKPELVALLEEDAQADFDERAAIMQYDGGMSREDAEAEAMKYVEPNWSHA